MDRKSRGAYLHEMIKETTGFEIEALLKEPEQTRYEMQFVEKDDDEKDNVSDWERDGTRQKEVAKASLSAEDLGPIDQNSQDDPFADTVQISPATETRANQIGAFCISNKQDRPL